MFIRRIAQFGVPAFLLLLSALAAAEEARVTVPAGITFFVTDVASTTSASSNPVVVSFQEAVIDSGKVLRVSVRAVASNFTPPSGNQMAASRAHWTIASATSGSGFAGAVDGTNWVPVYQSVVQPTSGSVQLQFQLNAPGASIRAGEHTLELQWLFESIPQ